MRYNKPMTARDINEVHRVSTPLELLFDLVTVIAVAAAVAGLHHAIAQGHIMDGVVRYVIAFFCVWWAWMNYTWFASAYDNDDMSYRLLTMIIMAGALTLATGISVFFDTMDLKLILFGYVIMRCALAVLWLRAWYYEAARRPTTLRYAVGIILAQIYWCIAIMLYPTPASLFYSVFVIGVVIELAVPIWAERQGNTPWHRHHIMERYGLLNIIVLGETLLAGSLALRGVLAHGHFNISLIYIALSALIILFCMWWLYFAKEAHLESQVLARAFAWGYGHAIIYISGAAVGAGFAVLVDIVTQHAHVGRVVGDYAVAIPVAMYLIGLWFVRDRYVLTGKVRFVLPVFALMISIAPMWFALEGIAVLMVLCVVARSAMTKQTPV